MSRSFFVGTLLLDVEVSDLVCVFVAGHHIQELPQRVLLEVLLGQVLKVPLGQWDA